MKPPLPLTPSSVAKAKSVQSSPPAKKRIGRPPKFESVGALQKEIDAYFALCDARFRNILSDKGEALGIEDPAPYTKEGLAAHLDVIRDTLHSWESGERGKEFSDAIKKAYHKIESELISRLCDKRQFTPGIIFYLKNAYGYRDTQDVKHSGSMGITLLDDEKAKDLRNRALREKRNV